MEYEAQGEIKKEADSNLAGVGEIREEFFRSGGKGGQNVDKVETGVRLRALIDDQELLRRLRELYPGSVTDSGEFLIRATRERHREQNRARAYKILEGKLARARETPQDRIPTAPTRSSREKRLGGKRRTSSKKELRKPVRGW